MVCPPFPTNMSISFTNIEVNKKVADTLDRCEVPFFGKLASSILDDE